MTDYESVGDYQAADESAVGLALTFLFIGIGVGALVTLLLTPKTGKQMRRSLRRKYEDAREAVEDWSDQANDIIEKGTEWANAAKEKVAPLSKVITRKT
jgi:gas vesicle protein